MLTDKATIVFTFDDIVVDNTYDLYLYMCEHCTYYGIYFDLFNLKTKEEINERKAINLFDSLDKSSILNNSANLVAICNNVFTNLFSTYYQQTGLYDIERLTKLAKNGLNHPLFKNSNAIKKLICIIKYRTPAEKERKTKFINTIFGENVSCIYVPFSRSYTEEISKLPWNLLITDDITCIEELAAGDIDHKEFMVPLAKYTEAKPELIELIKQKSGTLSYYKK